MPDDTKYGIFICMNYKVIILEQAIDFIESQNEKMKAKIFRTIGLLKMFGYDLKEPHVKKIQGADDIFELRVKVATNISRLFFFHFTGKEYVVTSGYIKKEDKTNPREITKAKKIMVEFLNG